MERLSPQDLMTLWPEQVGSPQDVGALAVLDTAPESGDSGPGVDAVRAFVAGRLHLAPRLRQVIYCPPPGLGRPVWADAPQFDIARHVQERAVPTPGTEAQLLATVEGLRRRPLDRALPLWEMWLLPGLIGGRTGLYIRVHHVLADGAAVIALLGGLLGDTQAAADAGAQPWTPGRLPTSSELLADNLHRCGAALGRAAAVVAHPAEHLPRAGGVAEALRSTGVITRAPRTSLNRPIGRDRRLLIVRTDLKPIRDAAHACEASVNDVVLTAVADGLRDLLGRRGEQIDDLVLRAIVPIALPHQEQQRQQGNVLGQMIVPLSLARTDPASRLRQIAADTAARKRAASPRRVPVLRSRALQRAAMAAAAHQRAYNVYVANVRGPEVPLHLAGATLLDAFPVVPLLGNATIGVGALSYAGQLNILTVGDRTTCPDVDVFVNGLESALQSWS